MLQPPLQDLTLTYADSIQGCDAELISWGLSYYRARYYDPSIGRFLNEDPVGFDGGVNLYVYVRNKATELIDPFGWSPTSKDKWYGHNEPDFHKWFHRCWKQPGDPDACKEKIEEAYREWEDRGKPKGGKCGSPKGGSGRNQKTNFEIQKDIESTQDMENFWWDILAGDAAIGIVGTMGAFGWLGGGAAGAAEGAGGAAGRAQPLPFPKPAPPPPAVPVKPAA
jgi:RHS repeat-associated protein